MICRVCLLGVKKNAVICEECSLISHNKCSVNAPPTCDLRAQLLLYAQYAEKGNPTSVYSNPTDILHSVVPTSPASDVSFVAHTRTTPDVTSPPTAFKFVPFRRPNWSQTPEPAPSPPSSLPSPSPLPREPERRHPVLRNERPVSFVSNNTSLCTSSTRSAATAAESLSSGTGDGRFGSTASGDTESGTRMSPAAGLGVRPSNLTLPDQSAGHSAAKHDEGKFDCIPGGMPSEGRSQKKRNKDSKIGACTVQ